MLTPLIDKLNSKRMPGVQDWRRQQLVPSLLIAVYLLSILGAMRLGGLAVRALGGSEAWAWVLPLIVAAAGFAFLRGLFRKKYPHWNESYWNWKKRMDGQSETLGERE